MWLHMKLEKGTWIPLALITISQNLGNPRTPLQAPAPYLFRKSHLNFNSWEI